MFSLLFFRQSLTGMICHCPIVFVMENCVIAFNYSECIRHKFCRYILYRTRFLIKSNAQNVKHCYSSAFFLPFSFDSENGKNPFFFLFKEKTTNFAMKWKIASKNRFKIIISRFYLCPFAVRIWSLIHSLIMFNVAIGCMICRYLSHFIGKYWSQLNWNLSTVDKCFNDWNWQFSTTLNINNRINFCIYFSLFLLALSAFVSYLIHLFVWRLVIERLSA